MERAVSTVETCGTRSGRPDLGSCAARQKSQPCMAITAIAARHARQHNKPTARPGEQVRVTVLLAQHSPSIRHTMAFQTSSKKGAPAWRRRPSRLPWLHKKKEPLRRTLQTTYVQTSSVQTCYSQTTTKAPDPIRTRKSSVVGPD
jgi:hypothetical protein